MKFLSQKDLEKLVEYSKAFISEAKMSAVKSKKMVEGEEISNWYEAGHPVHPDQNKFEDFIEALSQSGKLSSKDKDELTGKVNDVKRNTGTVIMPGEEAVEYTPQVLDKASENLTTAVSTIITQAKKTYNDNVEKQTQEILDKGTLFDEFYRNAYLEMLKYDEKQIKREIEKLRNLEQAETAKLEKGNQDRYIKLYDNQTIGEQKSAAEKTKHWDVNSPSLTRIKDQVQRKTKELSRLEKDNNIKRNSLENYLKQGGRETVQNSFEFKVLREDFEKMKNDELRHLTFFKKYVLETIENDLDINALSDYSFKLKNEEKEEIDRKINVYKENQIESEIQRIRSDLMSKGVTHESAEAQSRLMANKGIRHDEPRLLDKIQGAIGGGLIGLVTGKGFFKGMKDGWILGTNGFDAISGNIKLEKSTLGQAHTSVKDNHNIGSDLGKVQTEISKIKAANTKVVSTVLPVKPLISNSQSTTRTNTQGPGSATPAPGPDRPRPTKK